MRTTWETRIFVPWTIPFDALWAETLLGSVVRPLVADPSPLEWFWFSRYVADRGPGADVGSCEIDTIPSVYFNPQGYHRSLRLRYALPTDESQTFEKRARELIAAANAAVSDFRPWNMLGDLGGDRFVGEPRSPDRRERRARLIVDFLHSVSTLTLDCLVETDGGRWTFEANDDRNSPNGSSFESPLHLFCNMTDVPVVAHVRDLEGRVHDLRLRL
jgi:hypothetical protein